MVRSLWLLRGLLIRGWARRLGRSMGTRRGKVFFGLGLLLMLLWLVSLFGSQQDSPFSAEAVQRLAPVLMGLMAVTMIVISGGRVVSFSPAEVHFLFPGPFSRRQLMGYKITTTVLGSLVTAAVFSIWQSRHVPTWVGCFVALLLLLVFSQLLAMLFALLRRSLSEQGSLGLARVLAVACLLALLAGIAEVGRELVRARAIDLVEAMNVIRQTVSGQVVLAPFDLLSRVLLSPRLGAGFLLSAAQGASMVAATGLLVLVLDEAFVEAALHSGPRRGRRRGHGAGALSPPRPGRPGWSLPSLPRWHGAGSIAWRQCCNVQRNFRGIVLLLLFLAVVSAPLMMMSRAMGEVSNSAPMVLVLSGPYALLILPGVLRFDFRSEVDHLDFLKSLPISPMAMAVGQVVAPTVVLSGILALPQAMVAVLVPALRPWVLLGLLFTPVVSLLLMAVQNTLFLLAPARATPSTPGDLQYLGRQTVLVLARVGILGVSGAVALGLALGVSVLAVFLDLPESAGRALAAGAGWGGLMLASWAVLRAGARLFERFDPGVHETS